MFGFNSWTDFTNKAAESLQNASESAKSGLKSVSNKTKEFADSFPENAKNKFSKLQENVSTFVEDQRLQFQQVEHETELRKRRKERKAKLLKYGIPPWHIFEDESNDVTPKNEESKTDETNNNNNNNSNKKNCTYEELRLLILKLCEDETTFLVEAPSSESVFAFSMETALPYANAALNYDPILPRIRYKMVPKKLSETQFWKNYFYRVQLIRESMGYPKLDLSANAPSMDLLKRQIADSVASPENANKNNNNNNKKNENRDNENLNSKNNNTQHQSIFETNNNDNENTQNGSNNTNKTMSPRNNSNSNSNINKNTNNNNNSKSNLLTSMNASNSSSSSSSNSSQLLSNGDTESDVVKQVISLDTSESVSNPKTNTITSNNDESIVNVTTKKDLNNRLTSVSSATLNENDDNDNDNENNNENEDDEDDDFMASNDLHIDALSPEARARIAKELGLKDKKQGSSQSNNNNDKNKSPSKKSQNSNNNNNNNDDDLNGDTEDVDALLAGVDVDGASDISDDELAKVMSEVENT